MSRTEWSVQQAVVEIRYERGIVYLDRCGSLMLALEDKLGKPFTGSVPGMEYGELSNGPERLAIRFGPKIFYVNQHWVKSPARVEHLAPIAWEQVAQSLGVEKQVSRCGVRFILAHAVASTDEGKDRLARSKLAMPADRLGAAFPTSRVGAWVMVFDEQQSRIRIGLEVAQISVEGAVLPPDLAEIVPNHAIALDVDHAFPVSGTATLSKADLKEFIRSSWQRTRAVAKLVAEGLGFEHGAE